MTNLVVKKQRNSSVELFRILATFLVLIVHLNGWLLGGTPETFSPNEDLSFRVGQLVVQSLSVVCVNCFIIISGYFGINLSLRSLLKYFATLFGMYFPCWIVSSIALRHTTVSEALDGIFVLSREGYFVQCYFMLMFLSPILNSFVEKFGKSILKYVLIFWAIEIWFEQVRGNISLGFNGGYSVIHFVLVYLLARCLALYKDKVLQIFTCSKSLLIYFVLAGVVSLEYIIMGGQKVWDYSNPIILLESFFLFIPFLYYPNYFNKRINWIASSTFAVYVLHTCKPLNPILRDLDRYVLSHYSNLFFIIMLFLAILTFVMCIVYDKIRARITNPMLEKINNKISSYKIL